MVSGTKLQSKYTQQTLHDYRFVMLLFMMSVVTTRNLELNLVQFAFLEAQDYHVRVKIELEKFQLTILEHH
jgi:hypothetical protein